jgi:4'-phosphopantetheinyl transferase
MSLASHLLKHLVITKYCNVPWPKSTISRDQHGKPCFISERSDSGEGRIDFNVSHQAGIVSLIAAIGSKGKVDVGTDVVCANERILQDYAHIDKDGFFAWVDIYGEVFAESEMNHLKLSPVWLDLGTPDAKLSGYGRDAISRCQWRNGKINVVVVDADRMERSMQVSSSVVIDAKLRRFYAMWCLREAYVKMTGEALLAPWLQQLEISDVEAPAAKDGIRDSGSLEEGELVNEFRIDFKRKLVTNVKMELSALGKDFMVAGSVMVPAGEDESALKMGKWDQLDLERDVLVFAESKP